MLWIHPIVQSLTTLAALYVAVLGLKRFSANHLGGKALFAWKTHVLWGKVVLAVWFLGGLSGKVMTETQWGGSPGGTHLPVAQAMLVLIAVGFATGWYMDRRKTRRTWLPLAHGLANITALGLAFWQVCSGIEIINEWLL